MPPKPRKEVVTHLADETEFRGLVGTESDTRLHIVDVYAGWSGPCQQIVPTFKGLQISIDCFDERVSIVQIEHSLVAEVAELAVSSKPRFLFFKEGVLLQQIEGCQAPEILKAINTHLPPLANDDE